jgi:hypothetical protein
LAPLSHRLARQPVPTIKAASEAAKGDYRLHDLRHSFFTKVAEDDVPESTMLDMMGHMDTRISGRKLAGMLSMLSTRVEKLECSPQGERLGEGKLRRNSLKGA